MSESQLFFWQGRAYYNISVLIPKHRSPELALLDENGFVLHIQELKKKKKKIETLYWFHQSFWLFKPQSAITKAFILWCSWSSLTPTKIYIENQKQYLCGNNFLSSVKSVFSDVYPQGSVLGRFIFNMHANDIVNVSQNTTCKIYA